MSQTITQTETIPSSTAKKRKSKHQLIPNPGETPSKKHKRDGHKLHSILEKDKRKEKEKGKEKEESDGEFSVVSSSITLSIPPLFSKNPQNGVEQMLDSMVMRYIPALRGVVISHSNVHFVGGGKARIIADCPNTIVDVKFDAMVWSPRIRMKLSGIVNVCSPDHIAMLVHRTFNVSIPRHHIPTEEYEFEHGPAENDPEYGIVAGGEEDITEEHTGSGGRWVHKITREPLGGKSGRVEFTVIGLMVANEMLSLSGSLLDDPFDPRHVPQPPIHHTKTPQPESDIEDEIEEDKEEEEEDEDEIESVSEDEIAAPVRRKPVVKAVEKRERDEKEESISTKKDKKRRK